MSKITKKDLIREIRQTLIAENHVRIPGNQPDHFQPRPEEGRYDYTEYEDTLADSKSGRRQVVAKAMGYDGELATSKPITYSPTSPKMAQMAYIRAAREAWNEVKANAQGRLKSRGQSAVENEFPTAQFESKLQKEKPKMKITKTRLKGLIDEEVARAIVEFTNEPDPGAIAGGGRVDGGPISTEGPRIVSIVDERGHQVDIEVSSEMVDGMHGPRESFKAKVPVKYPDTSCAGKWGQSIISSVDAVIQALEGCAHMTNVTRGDIQRALSGE